MRVDDGMPPASQCSEGNVHMTGLLPAGKWPGRTGLVCGPRTTQQLVSLKANAGRVQAGELMGERL